MKLHRIVASLGALLLTAMASPTVNALDVRLYLVNKDSSGNITGFTQLSPSLPSSDAAVNLDSDSPVGAAKTYGILNNDGTTTPVITIAKCSGCAGRARVFVSEGSVDKLVMTDALITNVNGATATVRVDVSWTSANQSGPGGDYPYATELSGTFTAPFGQLATDPANRIELSAFSGICEGGCMIDNPALDAGETFSSQYSLVAPPFLSAGVASFAPKEQQVSNCSNVYVYDPDTRTYTYFCKPSLSLSADITLKNRHGAKLQGSVGAFHVPTRCEPDNGLLEGCEIMSDFFASLGPKGFKVYDVRLEPSPGTQRNIDFRNGTPNSSLAWVSKRGADEDDDRGSSNGVVSNTRARLSTNGSGEVKASGLCPVTGCVGPKVLPVRVYCGQQDLRDVAVTMLQLNNKGDGRATLSFSTPCPDPAVLIMDEDDNGWVAAPAIL